MNNQEKKNIKKYLEKYYKNNNKFIYPLLDKNFSSEDLLAAI